MMNPASKAVGLPCGSLPFECPLSAQAPLPSSILTHWWCLMSLRHVPKSAHTRRRAWKA